MNSHSTVVISNVRAHKELWIVGILLSRKLLLTYSLLELQTESLVAQNWVTVLRSRYCFVSVGPIEHSKWFSRTYIS